MPNAYRTFEGTLRSLAVDFVARLPFVILGLFVIVFFAVMGRIVRSLLRRVGARSRLHRNLTQLVGQIAASLLTVLGVLVAAVVVFPAFRPGDLVAGLGITTVAVGFAFKDILQNFFAGLLILWRQPFKVGDEIVAGKYEGVVEEITSRSTRIRTYDGERAVIPNGDIYTSSILVRTAYDHRRVRVTVGIGYRDSITEARNTIHRVLESNEQVLSDPGPRVYVSELAPSSVNLSVYFWTASNQANVLKVGDRVVTEIKEALDAAEIDMPYPHLVVLMSGERDFRSDQIN